MPPDVKEMFGGTPFFALGNYRVVTFDIKDYSGVVHPIIMIVNSGVIGMKLSYWGGAFLLREDASESASSSPAVATPKLDNEGIREGGGEESIMTGASSNNISCPCIARFETTTDDNDDDDSISLQTTILQRNVEVCSSKKPKSPSQYISTPSSSSSQPPLSSIAMKFTEYPTADSHTSYLEFVDQPVIVQTPDGGTGEDKDGNKGTTISNTSTRIVAETQFEKLLSVVMEFVFTQLDWGTDCMPNKLIEICDKSPRLERKRVRGKSQRNINHIIHNTIPTSCKSITGESNNGESSATYKGHGIATTTNVSTNSTIMAATSTTPSPTPSLSELSESSSSPPSGRKLFID